IHMMFNKSTDIMRIIINIMFDENGNTYDFMGGEESPRENHLMRFEGYSKIYRKTYSIQRNSLAMIHGKEDIPLQFVDPCVI
ncbi:MAG: hypothetical protein LUD02_10535, partial [Tannerellaceae bacterium]|nr:hypothetical protein [Tannerellaceae bacterium]